MSPHELRQLIAAKKSRRTTNALTAAKLSARPVVRTTVTAEDVMAYIAGVAAHPAYSERFQANLTQPGLRIPTSGAIPDNVNSMPDEIGYDDSRRRLLVGKGFVDNVPPRFGGTKSQANGC
jgi:hypothetical protein